MTLILLPLAVQFAVEALGFHYFLAKIILMILFSLINFILNYYITFRMGKEFGKGIAKLAKKIS